MATRLRFLGAATLTLGGIVALGACAADGGLASGSALRIESLSTRPYLVTGGDVLLAVEVGAALDAMGLQVLANGEDVTPAFRPAPDGRRLVGLVQGLVEGPNTVEARIPGGPKAALEVTSYPIHGPIISGPHQEPYLCQTEEFELPGGGLLGAPQDEHCSVPTRVDYVYMSSVDGDFKPYPGGSAVAGPDDVARVTTLDGRSVPFIARVQTGTVNRAIYQSAMLHDPSGPAPDPWTRSPGWNGKLVYTHGGGCRSGWYRQGASAGEVLQEGLLAMGFAVTSASHNVFGNNCNDLLASETHIMVKERFIESYGEPIYTIGTGGSGGSYQSHQTADNYPGVFDGVIVSSSFPDVASATIFTLADARLLHHYFTAVASDAFTQEQQRMVSGFGSWGSIANLAAGAARIDPTYEQGAPAESQGAEMAGVAALEARRYNPSNPDGLRATVYDHTVNVYGVDESTGFAGRPLDNHGVQYGLAALNRGDVTKSQFLALNRDIGGFDADLNHVPARHRADPGAARRALGTGRILNGGAGLASTPVIDYRSYTDDRAGGDIHMIVHQFTTRARLHAANGHADNHVMAVGGRWGYTPDRPDLGVLFRQMDAWLMDLVSADDEGPREARVAGAKPADLADHCWDTSGAEPVRVTEPLSYEGGGRCGELYRAFPTPRQVAGAPLTNDIVSCRLKPLDPADYSAAFTSAEWAELQSIFAEGVCDWSAGDAHDARHQGTWLSFGPSEVNRAR
jgi:hypothetical protein